ncbi:transcription termination/antitermination NusG family protein [uncultured Treponema sp.]|uniref:transcription termination/antitermination NusG family protein n=1 Tax=uncultured Treponema sp. TaxID=162155 RepID=UPI0025D4AD29|nr:transcription termination/antitermination NusG family protein [uncultured Treponema sp.]
MENYCIMVQTGSEEKFKEEATSRLSEIEKSSKVQFYFFKKMMRTNKGKTFEEPLFPGYIFLEADSLDTECVSTLKTVKNFYHFLKSNSDITELKGADLAVVEQFKRCGERLGFSKLYFEPGRKIVVVEGPLQGLEGKIIAVNKKRCRVTIQLDMMPNVKKIDLMYDLVQPV